MPDLIVALVLSLAVAVGWLGVIRLARSVRRTSLTAAVAWAIWFQVTLTATTIATLAKGRVPPGILDQLWYLTAVSALCPFVAVLGARRGRLLDWSLFVLLPLIGVLEWPALAQLTRCWNGQRLELETPTLLGYSVVLLMAVGNFFPTRFGWASLVWMTGWGWELGQMSDSFRQTHTTHIVPVMMLLVFWENFVRAAKRGQNGIGWNRLWFDFRDWFGVAWATRLSARINEIAEREKWPWRLTHEGWRPASREAPECGPAADDSRVDHTCRWLLKPFVNSEWIDERLNAASPTKSEH